MEAKPKNILPVGHVIKKEILKKSCKFILPLTTTESDNESRRTLLQDLNKTGVSWNENNAKIISDYFQVCQTELNMLREAKKQLQEELKSRESMWQKYKEDKLEAEMQHWASLSKNLETVQGSIGKVLAASQALEVCRKELHTANMEIIDLKIQNSFCKCKLMTNGDLNVGELFEVFSKSLEAHLEKDADFKKKHKSEIEKLEKLLDLQPKRDIDDDEDLYEPFRGKLLNDVDMGYSQLKKPSFNNCNDSKMQYLWHLHKYCDIPCTEENNYPLHEAVISNNLALVEIQCKMLKYKGKKQKGCSIDLINNEKHTPFHLAIMYNADINITKYLFAQGANLSLCDWEGNNIVHLAVTHNYLSELISAKVLPNKNQELLNKLNYEGYSPLHLAVKDGNTLHCHALINLKADLDITDRKSGMTALFLAVESNNVEICQLLCKSGADRKIPNFAGYTLVQLIHEQMIMPEPEILKLFYNDKMQLQKLEVMDEVAASQTKKRAAAKTMPQNRENGKRKKPF